MLGPRWKRKLAEEKLSDENVSGLRRVEAGLSHLKSGFDPSSVHVVFKADKVSFRQVSLRVLQFSPASVIPRVLHAIIQLYIILKRRTNGRSLGTFQKAMLFW